MSKVAIVFWSATGNTEPMAARLGVQSSWRRASSSLCLLRWKAL